MVPTIKTIVGFIDFLNQLDCFSAHCLFLLEIRIVLVFVFLVCFNFPFSYYSYQIKQNNPSLFSTLPNDLIVVNETLFKFENGTLKPDTPYVSFSLVWLIKMYVVGAWKHFSLYYQWPVFEYFKNPCLDLPLPYQLW